VKKTLKTATRIAAGSALAVSALALVSMPAHAAGSQPSLSDNKVTVVDGPLVDGPLIGGPVVDFGQLVEGPFQFGQFQ